MVVYLNGEYLPLDAARVSVLDRGFLLGDGVYEVIPVYDRRPFRLEAHLTRLQHSLDAIRLANPHTPDRWAKLIEPVVEHAEWEDQGIYLQVTRGVAPRDQAFPRKVVPTVFIMPMELTAPTPEMVAQGVSAITAVDDRWQHGDIKTISLLANVLLRQQSVDAGCAETILIRDGFLTEGSASNVFLVKEGVILAPPKSPFMLPGITYDVVLELAEREGVPVLIRPISSYELKTADEVWVTSSTKEITAITRLDEHPVGGGQPGALYKRLYAAYQTFKHAVMRQPS